METDQAPLNVLILAHHSLLSGGIASALSEYGDVFNVRTIDMDAINFTEVVQSESPAIIILDAGDFEVCQKIPVTQLLEWAPKAKIIRLDLSSNRIRIFSSMELQSTTALDLANLLQKISKTELGA